MSITRFPLALQWGHVGSELVRANQRYKKGDMRGYESSMLRVLDMLHDMINDHQEKRRLVKECCLFREFLLESFYQKSFVPETLVRYCQSFLRS